MQILSFFQRFLYGVIGSGLFELYRWYKFIYETKPANLADDLFAYLAISALFIIGGGFFAAAWRDNQPVHNIIYGLGCVMFVSGFWPAP